MNSGRIPARFGLPGVALIHALGLTAFGVASLVFTVLEATQMGVPFIAWGWVRLFSQTSPVSTSRNRRLYLAVAAVTLVAAVSVLLVVRYQFSSGDAVTAAVVSNLILIGFTFLMRSQDVGRWRQAARIGEQPNEDVLQG